MQPLLAGDVAHQIDDELQVRLAAGAAAGADQQRRSRRIAIVEQKGLPEPR